MCVFFFQAEDGIRDLVRSRGLGDVYKRQNQDRAPLESGISHLLHHYASEAAVAYPPSEAALVCLLYTSDAADERSSVDLGGRRIIKKKKDMRKRRAGHENANTQTTRTYR